MRRIAKRKPGPTGLLELRRQGEHYDALDQGKENARTKRQVRQALLEDQGFLCCYCMRSLDPEKHHVRIEHHQSQSRSPDLDLDWNNPNGRIEHPVEPIQDDIDDLLNLNVGFLVEERLEARIRLIDHLRRELGPDKTWTAAALQRYLDARRSSRRLAPYFGLLETLLARWITKRAR